jgi:hypothetical protein
MMNFLIGIYVKAMNKTAGLLKNERGSQSLEWIGIAALIVIVVGGLSQVFSGNTEFGDAIKKKLIELVEDIG